MTSLSAAATMTQQHVDALTLAGWGFNVGPLNGKIPLTPNGHKNFTSNINQVDKWWTRWPEANIGARVFSGHVVVDIDPRNGGNETWAHLTADQELPPTLTTRTGSGGRHIWYRLPYARPVKGTAGPGIDLKTSNGYLVMPGSYHPKTGRLYRCEHWAPVATLPPFLAEHVYRPRPLPPIVPVRKTTGSGAGLVNFVLESTDGERHNRIYWAALTAGKERLDIRDELTTAALSIHYPETDARRTIEDGYRAGLDTPEEFAA